MEIKQVRLTSQMSVEIKESIELFLYRSSELVENYSDLKKKGVNFGGLTNYSFEDGKISGPSHEYM
jgi:hypothetical protein